MLKQRRGQRAQFCKTLTMVDEPGAQPRSGMHDSYHPIKEPLKEARGGRGDGDLDPVKILPRGKGMTYLRWLQRDRLRDRAIKRQMSAQERKHIQ